MDVNGTPVGSHEHGRWRFRLRSALLLIAALCLTLALFVNSAATAKRQWQGEERLLATFKNLRLRYTRSAGRFRIASLLLDDKYLERVTHLSVGDPIYPGDANHPFGHQAPANSLESIDAFSKLEELLLSHQKIGSQAMAAMGRLKQLKRLVLSDCTVTDAELKQLAGLRHLEELCIENSHELTGDFLRELANLKQLKSVDLICWNLATGDGKRVAEFQRLRPDVNVSLTVLRF